MTHFQLNNNYIFTFFFRKYLIENVRASLFCPDQSQLLYTQSCYEFRMESNRITPSNIADMGGDPRQFDHIAFEDDWTNRRVIFTKQSVRHETSLISSCFFVQLSECSTLSRYGRNHCAENQLESFQWNEQFSLGCLHFVWNGWWNGEIDGVAITCWKNWTRYWRTVWPILFRSIW